MEKFRLKNGKNGTKPNGKILGGKRMTDWNLGSAVLIVAIIGIATMAYPGFTKERKRLFEAQVKLYESKARFYERKGDKNE